MKIEFELGDSPVLFGEAKNIDDSLHEALCKAIHEQDHEAIEWLNANIIDIRTGELP